ncbi:MAG: nucleotidyl transferase AbiEii/AbiGii toxin family protein, partial [bacterium]
LIMGRILRDIYSNISICPLLGFKGGTCAHFFYNLPRFSVDLDFDLFHNDKETKEKIFKKVEQTS